VSILIGHPTGTPFAYHCALAYFENAQLESFCVPWMPSSATLLLFDRIKPIRPMVQRLSRRHFPPLANAPKTQGRLGEMRRLVARGFGFDSVRLQIEANEWLMQTMARECSRPAVAAVHAYEDCSLWQFRKAKRLGKACIYDGFWYYPVWQSLEKQLNERYSDWLPQGYRAAGPLVSAEHKREEIELADLVLVPSAFAEQMIRAHFPTKNIAKAAYGVDSGFWTPGPKQKPCEKLRFISAGQQSIRKGTPLLIEAWKRADLHDAELELVGSWGLAESKRAALPPNVFWRPPCSSSELRDRYRQADVFVFPSYFDGFGLVAAEALACGLPAICSDATGAPDFITESCGRVIPSGDLDALVESLKWFDRHRDQVVPMGRSARAAAEVCTWENYRRSVNRAVKSYI
jgi:glycosyltransferase involved in cell wall biosynthesis